ncbi:RNA polymerase factor sigma-70 [Streptomyces azureus]|uniref:RNA polymerase factor sigma-70 n=1 Tax=Streptomyces azureus TaxID=146537 RepID=A0A0K8PGK3_STRAJ|nr:RNA polymerase factor sigma-70 [Streptomyces azureus]
MLLHVDAIMSLPPYVLWRRGGVTEPGMADRARRRLPGIPAGPSPRRTARQPSASTITCPHIGEQEV